MTPEEQLAVERAKAAILADIERSFRGGLLGPESPGDQLSVAIGAVEATTGGRVTVAYVDGDSIYFEWERDA